VRETITISIPIGEGRQTKYQNMHQEKIVPEDAKNMKRNGTME
jgi:hypothetical protein